MSAVIDAPVFYPASQHRQTLEQLQVIDQRACLLSQTDGFWDELESAAEDAAWGFADSVSIRRVMVALDLPPQLTMCEVADYFWWKEEQEGRIDHSFDGHMGEFR